MGHQLKQEGIINPGIVLVIVAECLWIPDNGLERHFLDLKQTFEAGHMQYFPNIHRWIVEFNFLNLASQRRQDAEHTAGNESDTGQIERQHFTIVLFDQLKQLLPISCDADFVRDVLSAKPDDCQFSGLIDFQYIGIFEITNFQCGIARFGFVFVVDAIAHHEGPQIKLGERQCVKCRHRHFDYTDTQYRSPYAKIRNSRQSPFSAAGVTDYPKINVIAVKADRAVKCQLTITTRY